MAGYGAIRRRLDLLLEAFSKVPECELWVCGGIRYERDFFAAYHKELNDLPNIHYQGWVDVGSEEYRTVTSNCGYIIYPSTSDGLPGSVVNAMASGLVPQVTKETGIDTGGLGTLIEDTSVEGLVEVIKQSSAVSPEDLKQQSTRIAEFTHKTYSKAEFLQTFRESLKAVLGNENTKQSDVE